jgi:hypothetical protein
VCLLTIVQTSTIYFIRNTFRLASKRDWDALMRDVKPDLDRDRRDRRTSGVRRSIEELVEFGVGTARLVQP